MIHTDEQLMLCQGWKQRRIPNFNRSTLYKHFKLYLSVCQKPNTCGRPLSGNILTVMAPAFHRTVLLPNLEHSFITSPRMSV